MNENIMEFSTFSMKEEFEELLEDMPDLVKIEEIKILKDDSSDNFMNNSFCSANVKSEFKKDNEDNCISPANQFHRNETISEKEENVATANIRKSSTFSMKEEFEELPENKPDQLEIQEIKILKEDNSSNNFMNNSFCSAGVKSEFNKDNEGSCIFPANQFHTNHTISEKKQNICSIESDENREIINKYDKKCRLCLRKANTSDYVLFNEMSREMLEILLTNVDIKESAPSVICKDCSSMLQEVFAFKSSCLDTEDSLTPFINPQNLGALDILTVFHEIRNDQKSLLPKNASICRFCLEILEKVSFIFLKDLSETDLDTLKKVMPEMQLEATKEPVICEMCMCCFKVCFKFINDCLNALKQYHNRSSISLNNNLDSISLSQNEIKSEKNNLVSSKADSENSRNPDDATLDPKGTKREYDENPSLAPHMDFHKDPDGQVYECDECSFRTKYKMNMKRHGLVHDKLFKCTKAKLYTCDVCLYQTIHKDYLMNVHKYMHKKPEEIEMQKCDKCPFETKCKKNLGSHIRRMHRERNPSLVNAQVYKCDKCSFETKYKTNMKRHNLIHDEVLYTCDICSYKTVHKDYLNVHKLRHKKPEEIELYKCQLCEYTSRYKKLLRSHELVHKDLSEVEQVFRCANCNFATKLKATLKDHMLVHRDVFNKCEFCNYKTRYKKNLNAHLKRIHKEKIEPDLTNT